MTPRPFARLSAALIAGVAATILVTGVALAHPESEGEHAGCIVTAEPGSIPASLDLAKATIRVMRENLAWAAGYNLLGIPLAAGVFYPAFHVLLSPWVAAAAMALSSVSVLSNSLRLRKWTPPALESSPSALN